MPRFFDVTRTRLRGAGPRVGRWGRSPSQPPRFAASRPLLPFAAAPLRRVRGRSGPLAAVRLRRFAAAVPLRSRPASPLRGRCPFTVARLRRFAAAVPLRSRPTSPLRGRCSPFWPFGLGAPGLGLPLSLPLGLPLPLALGPRREAGRRATRARRASHSFTTPQFPDPPGRRPVVAKGDGTPTPRRQRPRAGSLASTRAAHASCSLSSRWGCSRADPCQMPAIVT